MVDRYGGTRSTRWFVELGDRRFDRKVLLRAAHVHDGVGEMSQSQEDPRRMNAGEAERHSERRLYSRLMAREDRPTGGPSRAGGDPGNRRIMTFDHIGFECNPCNFEERDAVRDAVLAADALRLRTNQSVILLSSRSRRHGRSF